MVVLWPKGERSVTENGCFANTFGLNPEAEPVLNGASVRADAWLENGYQGASGRVNFFTTALNPAEVAGLCDVLIDAGANPDNVRAYADGQLEYASRLNGALPKQGWDRIR